MSGESFYADLPITKTFEDLGDPSAFRPLPEGWVVASADIVGSTAAVEAGRYKAVNTVGAAVISAQINAHDELIFPYVFGGDGASFAVPESRAQAAMSALAATRRWAEEEFEFELRVAIVPLHDIRAAGSDVRVARYAAAPQAIYAMFDGGGMVWVDEQMKQGHYAVDAAPEGTAPDLTGLSCRWTPMEPKAGQILSLLVRPENNSTEARAAIGQIMHLTEEMDRHGTPVPPDGPGYQWIPAGLDLEARATRAGPRHRMSLAKRKAQLLAETFIVWIFFIFKLRAGGFDTEHYTRTTGENADFRKFDDGLKMTIDCDDAMREKLEAVLHSNQAKGLIRYSLLEQESAIMTCIVPSVTSDDHVHFVDGGQGGYTKAATALKLSQ